MICVSKIGRGEVIRKIDPHFIWPPKFFEIYLKLRASALGKINQNSTRHCIVIIFLVQCFRIFWMISLGNLSFYHVPSLFSCSSFIIHENISRVALSHTKPYHVTTVSSSSPLFRGQIQLIPHSMITE